VWCLLLIQERVCYLQFGCGDDDGGGECDGGRKLEVFIGKKDLNFIVADRELLRAMASDCESFVE
jgi:hypothetical protein